MLIDGFDTDPVFHKDQDFKLSVFEGDYVFCICFASSATFSPVSE